MQSRCVSAAAAVVIAAALFTAQESGGSASAQAFLLAQTTGYDPMRRTRRPPDDAPRPEGNPDLGGLPEAPGAEETFHLCSACHSVALVKQQRLSDERWDYLWNWMVEEQERGRPGPA